MDSTVGIKSIRYVVMQLCLSELEDIEAQNVSSIGIKFHQSIEDDERQVADEEDIIFNTQRFNQRLVDSV